VEHSVEKRLTDELLAGASAVGFPVDAATAKRLLDYLDLLLKWNRKVNLTSVTDPGEAVEVHLVDSLAPARLLGSAGSLLDMGAGGGLPGIPLAIVLPQLRVTLVDSVGKKVGFLKAAIAALGLSNANAVQARVAGEPAREGLPIVDVAICRALMAPGDWVRLARPYIKDAGRILAMLGAETPIPTDLEVVEEIEYRLLRSKAVRRVVAFR
jgi:16S rRNA (guanine527-N7)-methyltransferase